MTVDQLKEQKIKELNDLYDSIDFNLENYMLKMKEYAIFCYENNLNGFSIELKEEKLERMYVVDSTPKMYDLDETEKNNIVLKLLNKEAITPEEAQIILQAVVQIARDMYSKETGFETSSLEGYCGYGTGLTYFPLNELGIKTTINNASSFPDHNFRHSFLTCFLPVTNNNNVEYKQYLIDTTYRQFFAWSKCNESRFYSGVPFFKNKTAPSVGYFLSQFKEGIEFSENLLKNGFVELTESNARLYGLGFSCETLSFANTNRKKEIISHTGKEYIDAINNPNFIDKIDFSFEDVFEVDSVPILLRQKSSVTKSNL